MFYHPVICPNSLKSRKCLNSECTFKWHLPHTTRVARERHDQTDKHANTHNARYGNRHRTNDRNNFRNANHRNNHYHDNSEYYNYNYNHRSNRYHSNSKYYTYNYDRDFPPHAQSWGRSSRGSPWGDKRDSSAWKGGLTGRGDNRHDSAWSKSNNKNVTGRKNNDNSFLSQQLQDSIAQQVQAAFQKINIADQIQEEMSKFQAQIKEQSRDPLPLYSSNNMENHVASNQTLTQTSQMNPVMYLPEQHQAPQFTAYPNHHQQHQTHYPANQQLY